MPRLIAVIFSLLGSAALAQHAGVSVQEGPHYVGEPVIVRVTAEGFEEDPQPQCQAGSTPAGLSLQLAGVRPSVSSVTQVINGKVNSYRRVSYTFDFHAIAQEPGTYRVAPFAISQAGREVRTRPFDLHVRDIESDDDMRVALILPGGTIYAGQRVPVTVQWWYAGEPREVRNLAIRSPLFDQFTFVDQEVSRDDTVLPIQTKKGTLQIKADAERKTLDGRSFVVFSAQRQLVAEKPGSIELAPITASIEKITRWGVDFFGRRQPVGTAKVRTIGKPQILQIQPLPLGQAPPSFAGAVGRGFTIAVKADRTVLRAGDPIVLTVTVRGDGDLTRAGPPRLSAQGGLDPSQFRPPAGDVAGTVTDEGKQFSMTVRVLDASVSQVPPISYSWFDPGGEQFETTTSRPIALQVLPTQMVTAQDVVSAHDSSPSASGEQQPEGTRPADTSDAADVGTKPFDLTGADLAIEPDVDRLLIPESGRFGGYRTHAAIYTGSLAMILLGWWRRQVAQADPQLQQQRKAIKQDIQSIHSAARLPRQEAAAQIATALRRLSSQSAGERRDQIDRLLAECDAVAYAPVGTDTQPLDGTLHQSASELAKAVMKEAS